MSARSSRGVASAGVLPIDSRSPLRPRDNEPSTGTGKKLSRRAACRVQRQRHVQLTSKLTCVSIGGDPEMREIRRRRRFPRLAPERQGASDLPTPLTGKRRFQNLVAASCQLACRLMRREIAGFGSGSLSRDRRSGRVPRPMKRWYQRPGHLPRLINLSHYPNCEVLPQIAKTA